MNWRGYREVAVKKLVLPGDIAQRQKLPHVIELAKDIKELGEEPIHAPTVHVETYALIAGRDRMAALLLNKAKKVWVRLALATPEEVSDLEVSENLYRRQDNRDELIARRVRKVAELLERDAQIGLAKRPDGGRSRSAIGEAREKVAREMRTTPKAIESAEGRAKAKRAEEEAADPTESIEQAAELPPPVETWGVPVDHLAQEFAAIRIVQAACDEADRAMRKAQAALSALADGSDIAKAIHARVYNQVHTAAYEVRHWRPGALCPYCKGLLHRRPTCSGCNGVGYVNGGEALQGVAEQLKRRGAAAVVPDGRGGMLTLAEASTAAGNPKPSPKKIAIELPDGSAFVEGEDIF